MGLTRVHVVSTGFAPVTKGLCLSSVKSQRGVEVHHHWTDAATQGVPPLSVSQNQGTLIRMLPPDAIVALVDLDDWLLDRHVLMHVAALHRAGAWVTYGQYVTTEHRKGHCAPYPDTNYRKHPWLASHLKTFRAGLYHRIRPDDLDVSGAHDVAAMLPMLEMAGPDRVKFVPWVSYVYNIGNSLERTQPHKVALERSEEARIKAMRPYERLEAL